MTDNEMADDWLRLKSLEKECQEKRIDLEKKMSSLFGIEETMKGTNNLETPDFKVKIVGSYNTKIDKDKLLPILEDNPELNDCFRWKPELEKAEYDKTSDLTKKLLSSVITTSPAKLSFTVVKK